VLGICNLPTLFCQCPSRVSSGPDRALAVLRRSEQARFTSANEEEVAELQGAIRARVRGADLQEKPTKRVKNRADSSTECVLSDSTKTAAPPANIAASAASIRHSERQRAEQSFPTRSRAALRRLEDRLPCLQEGVTPLGGETGQSIGKINH
jgi:hypothetical protein